MPKFNLKEGQVIRVTGYISEEPQVTGTKQTLKISKFEIITDKYPLYYYGDKISVVGKIISQKTFYFEKYRLVYPEIKTVETSDSSVGLKEAITKKAIWLKTRMREVFNKIFPRPFDGIMGGIVLGDKSLIGQGFWTKLKTTGTLHIMVASGSNIALFSDGLLSVICILFVRKMSLVILVSLIWFYTLMVGFQPPIVRAAVMASMLYASQIFGRQTETKRIFWATGILMIFINPSLVLDIGFWLSFSATGGLIYLQPIIKRIKFSFRTSLNESKKPLSYLKILAMKIVKTENFSSSISAQLATLPILLLSFGQFNLLSPVINLAILWVVPAILQAGIFLGIIGLIGGINLAKIVSFLVYPLLFYMDKVINLFSNITFFQWRIAGGGWYWAVGYYFILWRWIKNKS